MGVRIDINFSEHISPTKSEKNPQQLMMNHENFGLNFSATATMTTQKEPPRDFMQ